jgi:hypothetical protein
MLRVLLAACVVSMCSSIASSSAANSPATTGPVREDLHFDGAVRGVMTSGVVRRCLVKPEAPSVGTALSVEFSGSVAGKAVIVDIVILPRTVSDVGAHEGRISLDGAYDHGVWAGFGDGPGFTDPPYTVILAVPVGQAYRVYSLTGILTLDTDLHGGSMDASIPGGPRVTGEWSC